MFGTDAQNRQRITPDAVLVTGACPCLWTYGQTRQMAGTALHAAHVGNEEEASHENVAPRILRPAPCGVAVAHF